jgi:ferredoxin/flavodoxin---NADP+ reductase
VTQSTHIRAVVASRRDVSPELWVIRLLPDERLAFVSGQYVTIGLPDGRRIVERPYSVASSPREHELEFFVELVHGGKLTPQLYDVPLGGEVLLRRLAKGRFVFDYQSGHVNHFMVATVTGVAPFRSMLRDFLAAQAEGRRIEHRIVLLHAVSASVGFGYLDELSDAARHNSWFRYVPTVSRIWWDAAWTGEVGRADDILRKHLDALSWTAADTTVYLCGNPGMIQNAKGILQRAGFGKESVKEERYWVDAVGTVQPDLPT